MFNIMKNVWKILLKRKGYVLVAIIFPIVVTLLFTSIYTNNANYTVGIVNEDEGILGKQIEKSLDSLDVIEVKELESSKENINKLIFNEAYMIITIDKDFSKDLLKGEKGKIKFNAINKDEMTEVVQGIINTEAKSLATLCNNINLEKENLQEVLTKYDSSIPEYKIINNEDEKGVNIVATIGIMLYLIVLSAGMTSSILIEDEKNGTKNRTLMGKVSEKGYYGAMGFVFFIMAGIPAIEYYAMCKIFKYEIGFTNDIILLVLLLLMVLLSVIFTIMLSTLIKNRAVYGIISGTLTIPIFMLSGAFWESSMMSEGLQKIGSIFPVRWFMLGIEKLQQGASIFEITPIIIALISIIILFFFLSVFFTKNKIVLIKDN